MNRNKQMHAPVYEALERLKRRRVVPFDVPGHKRGRGNPELVDLLGEKCVSLDVNSMKPLDNLCHPVSVIKEAEELAAEAFRADHAFFMVGGTTSSVQGMVLSCCKAGDKIILPRNVHKSVINALVLCGAVPVYVNPEVDTKLGISLGMQVSEVERAIRENPDAAAVLVNNPTYYGICVRSLRWHMSMVCWCWRMRHMARICILAVIFRSVPWMPGQIWLRCPCINPAEA